MINTAPRGFRPSSTTGATTEIVSKSSTTSTGSPGFGFVGLVKSDWPL